MAQVVSIWILGIALLLLIGALKGFTLRETCVILRGAYARFFQGDWHWWREQHHDDHQAT